MKKIYIPLLPVVAVVVSACDWIGPRGNGNIVTDQRSITAFSEIEASGGLQIEWHPGSPSLAIKTDQNLLPDIDSSVTGSKLEIRTRDRLRPTHGIKVFVTSQTFRGGKFSGAVRLTANQISGAKFSLESTGAAQVILQGNVDELLADMTGASELETTGLQTKTVEIATTGAAEANLTVADTLRVSITGAGKVTYSGNPRTIEKHITGAGSIRHKD